MEEAQVVQWVHDHIRLEQAIAPGGLLREMDMFNNNPVQLEEIHPPLIFMTHVGGNKTRTALHGRWMRFSGLRKIQHHGVHACINRRYKFLWTRGINPRPRFEMEEYMRSAQSKVAICVVQRVGGDQVQEQGEVQVQEQGEGQDQVQGHGQVQEDQQGGAEN